MFTESFAPSLPVVSKPVIIWPEHLSLHSSPAASHCSRFQDSAAYECNGDGEWKRDGRIVIMDFCVSEKTIKKGN